jgi:hypothetical protein
LAYAVERVDLAASFRWRHVLDREERVYIHAPRWTGEQATGLVGDMVESKVDHRPMDIRREGEGLF